MNQTSHQRRPTQTASGASKFIHAYRVNGGYQLVDPSGVVCLLRCRDDVPDEFNADYVQSIQAAILAYGRRVGFYQ